MIRKLIGITALYLSVSLCGLAQTERIVILHTTLTAKWNLSQPPTKHTEVWEE